MEPTQNENFVLAYLRSQCNQVTKGKKPAKTEVNLIVRMCSAWAFGKELKSLTPEAAEEACHGLVQKGLVELRDDRGLPSYVPVEFL